MMRCASPRRPIPQLLVVHLPDLDEAGHSFGGASAQYRDVAGKVDADIARLVSGLQADTTTFVIVADHGHIASGGHGGWEPEVVTVPGVFSGAAVRLGSATGTLDQVAPTVAVLSGIRVPAYAESTALRSVLSTTAAKAFASEQAHHVAFDAHYTAVVLGDDVPPAMFAKGAAEHGGPDGYAAFVREARLDAERQAQTADRRWPSWRRWPLIIALIGFASWRASAGRARGCGGVLRRLQRAVLLGSRLPVVALGVQHRDPGAVVHERSHDRGGPVRSSWVWPSPLSSIPTCAKSVGGRKTAATCPGGSRSRRPRFWWCWPRSPSRSRGSSGGGAPRSRGCSPTSSGRSSTTSTWCR